LNPKIPLAFLLISKENFESTPMPQTITQMVGKLNCWLIHACCCMAVNDHSSQEREKKEGDIFLGNN
jgi:hypothetical protein